jgi:hypothetical protein
MVLLRMLAVAAAVMLMTVVEMMGEVGMITAMTGTAIITTATETEVEMTDIWLCWNKRDKPGAMEMPGMRGLWHSSNSSSSRISIITPVNRIFQRHQAIITTIITTISNEEKLQPDSLAS